MGSGSPSGGKVCSLSGCLGLGMGDPFFWFFLKPRRLGIFRDLKPPNVLYTRLRRMSILSRYCTPLFQHGDKLSLYVQDRDTKDIINILA